MRYRNPFKIKSKLYFERFCLDAYLYKHDLEKIQLFTTAYDMQFQQLGARNIFPIEEENEPKYYVNFHHSFK